MDGDESTFTLPLKNPDMYFKRGRVWTVMYGWLTENGEVSFHRSQMLAWTLVLGLIIVVKINADLAVPNFDATVLALMRISAGTYIGFNLPPPK